MKLSKKAMVIASKLATPGYSKAEAMKKAWALIKKPRIETKVSGVTFEKRQIATTVMPLLLLLQ
jgi:hypothetical protein